MLYFSPPKKFNPTTTGVGCFLEHDGKMLLLLRQDHKPQGNTWGQPAGKLEPGETPLQAIIREVYEETGIKSSDTEIKEFKTFFASYPEYDFIYHTFHLPLKEKPRVTIDNSCHKTHRWIGANEALSKLPLMPELDKCIEYFIKAKEPEDHPYLGVDAIIQNEKGEILLLKRSGDKKAYPDMWSLPSGMVEWGEEIKDAILREVKEETGLKVKVIKFTGRYYDKIGRHPTKTVICLPHYCKVIGGKLKINQESSESGWFSPKKLEKMTLAFDQKKMLRDEKIISSR